MNDFDFVVVLPAKPLSRAKSRLAVLGDEQRRELASAFLHDTVDAALAAEGVLAVMVVTDDFRLAQALSGRCTMIPDGVSDDLNATLRQASAEAARRWPDARPVALCADLPSLTPQALAQTLATIADQAPHSPAFVADRAGSGTTLYSAPYDSFRPRFGAGSAERHAAAGALRIDAPAPVTHDVDDVTDLARAMVLGLGPRSARASGRA